VNTLRDNDNELFKFLNTSTSPYHAVQNVRDYLLEADFTQLDEQTPWELSTGGYFIERDGSIAAWYFRNLKEASNGLAIVAAHTDSPNLRLKPVLKGDQVGLSQFGVEVYGGALLNSWLDRDLGISGRLITLSTSGEIEENLVQINEPLAKIPQLAIHLNRSVNENGLILNPQQHLRPIWNDTSSDTTNLIDFISSAAGIDRQRIRSWDLMLHDLQKASFVGADKQWIASARIDNLISCYASLSSFTKSASDKQFKRMPILCLFNHEEVGSTSAAGAAGNLLPLLIHRIFKGIDQSEALAKSTLVSADGAHATHPNYLEKHDLDHEIRMNAGIAIKRNSNERYATNAIGQATAQNICESNNIPYQLFSNRSDLACGSTIGPISSANLGISTIDLGVPQLSMHSTRELCGESDVSALENFLFNFFES